MDPNHLVPERLAAVGQNPDRYFQRCAPRPLAPAASGSLAARENLQAHRRGACRPKVHQHSRRELEARRANRGNRAIANSQDNGNNGNITSDSSDDGPATGSGRGMNKRNLSNSTSSMQYTGGNLLKDGGANGALVSSSTMLMGGQQQSTSTGTTPIPARRSGKYTASQSLLQQLKRSQSSHNNNNNVSDINNDQVNSSNKIDASNQQTKPRTLYNGAQPVEGGNRGIVKSASSFAFVANESPSIVNDPPSKLYQHYHQHHHQILSSSSPSSVASQPTAAATTTTTTTTMSHESYEEIGDEVQARPNNNKQAAIGGAEGGGCLKNDNSQRDLFDNSECFERSIQRSGLKKEISSSPCMTNSVSFSGVSETIAAQPRRITMMHDKQAIEHQLNNSQPAINVNKGDRRNSSSRDKLLFFDEKPESSTQQLIVGTGSALACAAPVPSPSSSSQTADLGSGEKIDSTNKKGTADDLISIADPNLITNQANNSSNNNNNNNNNKLNQQLSLDGCIKRHDNTIESNRKDDDKYINLFVYDNATHLQKAPTTLLTSERLQQQQASSYSKNNRYRARGGSKRSLNNRADSDKASDESFESSRDTIEITEIVEHENSPPHTVAPSVGSSASLFNANEGGDANEHPTAVYRQDIDTTTPNIISTHLQDTSQQLLTTDSNDNDDTDVVRHDASTEELCSTGDSSVVDQSVSGIGIASKKGSLGKSLDSEANNSKSLTHRSTSTIGTLQTVDEKAEINVVEDPKLESQSPDKIELLERSGDKMPANQPNNPSKKGFVPPGYPQRIRPQTGSGDGSTSNVSGTTTTLCNRDTKAPVGILSDRLVNTAADSDSSILGAQDLSSKNARPETQRVKFDDENLVSVKDDLIRPLIVSQSLTTDHKSSLPAPAQSTMRRNEHHPPQMPSISEAQYESELEIGRNDIEVAEHRDLSAGLSKISLTNSHNQEVGHNDEALADNLKQQHTTQLMREKSSSFYTVDSESSCRPIVETSQSHATLENSKSVESIDPPIPLLRHHRLPNETSHYSMVRSSNSTVDSSNNISSSDISNVPPRSSSIQFNTLSDGGESGPDESTNSAAVNRLQASSSRNFTTTSKKCDSIPITPTSAGNNRNNSATNSSSTFVKASVDDDEDLMMPTTKTALIFPRLDEGLSSEAESFDDEVEEDDERAMDADVEADDDDDDLADDDDLEDDIENDTVLHQDKGGQALQIGQSSVDNFLRQQQQQQQQQPKPQNRSIGSLQQQQQQAHGPTLDQADIHQMKAPGSAYGGYIGGQDSMDHNDLKAMTNYPANQNGQSNYWMGVPTSHHPNLSSQPSSSQQHFNQRNHNNSSNNNNSIMKGSNSFNRDEAKATNRLSSDTDNETDRLLGSQRNDQLKLTTSNDINSNVNSTDLQQVSNVMKQNASSKEVLIEGVLFNVKYLGSTHSDCEGRSEKEDRIHQAEMAVQEVKFRNGDSQSATEVQLFISTEKIMVLDDKHRKIMMDHSLRTISYIADIGDAIVLIVRKKSSSSDAATSELGRPVSKISCHVFESSESHTITKSISQAFQVAYTELLKANGTGDTSSYLPKELDYQEVLNSQEMSTDELEMFARKENQKEVIVPKERGEIIGLSIVESGWGSVLPTVVIASLKPDGPAYRCKKLTIGDQILSINGISLVGLPLAECQEILRKTKNQRVARLSIVPCPITVEVKIKRPDTKYQLGFSVQNGVICSLLRGGIAERGGVRVGHRIMSINGTTVVGVPHEKIVTLLASSVGEIRMKTCLTSLYRLILGEENPVHF